MALVHKPVTVRGVDVTQICTLVDKGARKRQSLGFGKLSFEHTIAKAREWDGLYAGL